MGDGTNCSNSTKFKVGYLTNVGDMLFKRQTALSRMTPRSRTDEEKLTVALFTDTA